MKKELFGFNLFSGGLAAISALIFFVGFYLLRANEMSKVQNAAEKYLVSQLENWKNGKINNVAVIVPEKFDGNLSDWEELKLSDYFIEGIKLRTKYVSKKRHGFWYYIYKLSASNMYVYATVELTMEDEDGYPETYKITYRLEPAGNGKWLVYRSKSFSLF